MFFLLVNVSMLVLSWIAAFYSMRIYAKASYNKIDSLHWGVSFFLIGLNFLMYIGIGFFVPTSYISHSVAAHFIDSYIWLTQIAIAIRLWQAYTDKKNLCIRLTRIVAEVLKVVILGCFIIVMFDALDEMYLPFKLNMQLLGSQELDMVVETIHALLALGIAIFVPYISFYKLVKLGFLLLSISEFIQVYNVASYYYLDQSLLVVEWVLAVIGLFAVLTGVLAVNKMAEDKERRYKERRVEGTDIKFMK